MYLLSISANLRGYLSIYSVIDVYIGQLAAAFLYLSWNLVHFEQQLVHDEVAGSVVDVNIG